MKIGVCIPCYYGHFGYLDCVLASIERQTVKPDVVSIHISSYPDNLNPPSFNSEKYKLLINTTSKEKNAAENRNLAAKLILNDVDILSFIDADDFCAPRRIEFIKNIFETQAADLVLHSYFGWTTELQQKHVNDILPLLNSNNPDKIILVDTFNYRILPYIGFGQIYISDNSFNFTNGHVSIKSSKFKEQEFPESELLFGCGEDSHFNYLHYKLGSKILATPLQLSLYAINTTNKESEINKELKKIFY